ncbi:glucoamylase family protein [Pedobacter sp. Leaf250]|uniref:glucoamylase family protein n=1 Tax=Pedobacter sp. Leaf250 TaxID=2876559 RepID=UPI001E655106|nr:glucoamylase family protein [Pedobacter sp. Leaf250]
MFSLKEVQDNYLRLPCLPAIPENTFTADFKVRVICKQFIFFLIGMLIAGKPFAQSSKSNPQGEFIPVVGIIKNISDAALLDIVQRQTFRYFWHFSHPVSGMARERDNTVRAESYWDYINEANDVPNLSKGTFGPEACAVGGTGMGIMGTVVAVERKWISRDAALKRLIKIVDFLVKADCYHGIYPHFLNGATGKTIPFDRIDDGADIVETSYLMMGLLTAKAYFNGETIQERYFRKRVDQMWAAADWNWHTKGEDKNLYWHWSVNNDFNMNFPVLGYSEALITYIISASSPNHGISKAVYENGWVGSKDWKNGKKYYGYKLPLDGYDKGGPLFFEQYTYLGINPFGLKDDHGIDYGEQTTNHTLINRAYCIENPKGYKGYGENCWGLTAGDSFKGYVAHCPSDDRGVIQPTAALSSFPYTPKYSMQALKHFYYDLGPKLWGPYGFADGFSEQHNWFAKTHLAIDQGPIVVMIENYRTGLLWKLFMGIPDIKNGLAKLGFKSEGP